MAKAVICPVCNGEGTYEYPPPIGSTALYPVIKMCHGCGGVGWVEVADSMKDKLAAIRERSHAHLGEAWAKLAQI